MAHIGEIFEENSDKYVVQPRYTTVFHVIRKKFDISIITYAVIDSIHKLSHTNPKYYYCTQSKENIAEFLGVSRRTVFYSIEEALEKGLIEKNEKGHLRTTLVWVELAELELHNVKIKNKAREIKEKIG